MGVTAYKGRTGKSEPLLRADDVDDAYISRQIRLAAWAICEGRTLALVIHPKVSQTKLLHILLKSSTLCPTVRLANEGGDTLEVLPIDGATHSC